MARKKRTKGYYSLANRRVRLAKRKTSIGKAKTIIAKREALYSNIEKKIIKATPKAKIRPRKKGEKRVPKKSLYEMMADHMGRTHKK